jgi:hypothetical protein
MEKEIIMMMNRKKASKLSREAFGASSSPFIYSHIKSEEN